MNRARSQSTLAAGTKTSSAIEIILDASGSMLQKLGGERRIDIAKKTLTKLTSTTIPAGTPFAFRVFGREVDSCQTDLDVPVGPLNPAAVAQRIAALVAKNGAKTPIGASLDKVADDLKSVTGEKLIVLVTDGEETCGGDPAASIERLRKAGIGTRVSIVGFALDDEKLATTFRRWSDAGGGVFFDAKDAAGLDKSLTEALRPGFEVVNAQGQVIASGLVGGDAVQVPAGNHTVRIKGRRKCLEAGRGEAEGNRESRALAAHIYRDELPAAVPAAAELYQPKVLRSAVMGSSQGSCSPFSAWTAVCAIPMPSSR